VVNNAVLKFTMQRPGVSDEVAEAKLNSADTSDNEGIGNDVIKLVRGDNSATFETAQGMAARLVTILGSSIVTYVPDDPTSNGVDESAITVNLGGLLPRLRSRASDRLIST
jgi:hypothetical protein